MRGVVVGKFMPPHAGHRFLIEMALEQVDELDVIVAVHESQPIPGELRAQWLREIYANEARVNVHLVPDIMDDENSEAWALYTIETLGYRPDIAFTSEEYGDDFARHLGARHVCVDLERNSYPIRGTVVRNDPLRYWYDLPPCVRAHYALRIAVVGAESTGTTTLAADLALHLETGWVREYGREFCDQLDSLENYAWKTEDFVHIAKTQIAREDLAARECNRVLICDTDPLATAIWHERYMGTSNSELQRIADERSYALYILTDDDIPFVQDGLRDGEHKRGWMTSRFAEVLECRRHIRVSGTQGERLQQAMAAITSLREANAAGWQSNASIQHDRWTTLCPNGGNTLNVVADADADRLPADGAKALTSFTDSDGIVPVEHWSDADHKVVAVRLCWTADVDELLTAGMGEWRPCGTVDLSAGQCWAGDPRIDSGHTLVVEPGIYIAETFETEHDRLGIRLRLFGAEVPS